MNDLKELVYVVTRNKLKSIELLDSSKKNRMLEFYELIAKDKLQTDEEASQHFFPRSKSNAAYRKLKANLKKRLINLLFVIDVKKPSYNDRKQAYYECHKEWAAARMLLAKNAWESSIDICHRILRHAMRYEFTAMALDLMRILRLNYSTRELDQKKYEEYRDLHEEYEQILIAENRAEVLYSELLMHFVNNRSTKKELHDTAYAAYRELAPLMEQYSSYHLHLYGYLVWMMTYTIINDYRQTLEVCRKMIAFFEAKDYDAETPLLVAYYQQLVCDIQLQEFAEGEHAARKCLEYIEVGTVNWFKYYELYIVLALHTGRYERALQIYQEVVSHKRFQFLTANNREIWRIYEGYLFYLQTIEALEIPEDSKFYHDFKLGRFMNEVPIFSKDKRGFNVAILIIQILFFFQRRQFDDAIDRMEAIEKYCVRYLNEEETLRSFYFIKMLLTIPAGSFDPDAARQKAAKYREKLLDNKLSSAQQTYQIEIIPYEKLWEFALNSL
jgi:hypothetical protein